MTSHGGSVTAEPRGEPARTETGADDRASLADRGVEDAFHDAVHQGVRQRETVAWTVVTPLAGDVHRRKRDDGAVEGTVLAQVPPHGPEVLDELGRRIRRCPSIEVKQRRAARAADHAAHGRRLCRIFPSAHPNRLRIAGHEHHYKRPSARQSVRLTLPQSTARHSPGKMSAARPVPPGEPTATPAPQAPAAQHKPIKMPARASEALPTAVPPLMPGATSPTTPPLTTRPATTATTAAPAAAVAAAAAADRK